MLHLLEARGEFVQRALQGIDSSDVALEALDALRGERTARGMGPGDARAHAAVDHNQDGPLG